MSERIVVYLVVKDNQQIEDLKFAQLTEVLRSDDLLVCNDSKVIRARLKGRKHTGGKLELLVERILGSSQILAQVKSRKALRSGDKVLINNSEVFEMHGRKGEFFVLNSLNGYSAEDVIDQYGSVPLPPYIDRKVESEDLHRYQSVYARDPGSVAAPTAGLHFSEQLIAELQDKGVEFAYLTLHVGAGTFAPVRKGQFDSHTLHSERCSISALTCERINAAKERGSRVIAVGTTSVRTLEAAAIDGELKPYSGETQLFIKPGFDFQIVDSLITNFHLPRSTLIMLVCAFAGTARVMHAYQYAIENGIRFYSYGDAMFVERNHI